MVVKPSARAPRTQELIHGLLKSSLDREAYSVSLGPLHDLLVLDFKIIIAVGGQVPSERKTRARVIQCESGLQVFCHIDTTTSPIAPSVAALVQSRQLGTDLSRINIVLIVQSKLQELKELVEKATGEKVREEPPEYLVDARPTRDLVFIGVGSTEEALLYLRKMHVPLPLSPFS